MFALPIKGRRARGSTPVLGSNPYVDSSAGLNVLAPQLPRPSSRKSDFTDAPYQEKNPGAHVLNLPKIFFAGSNQSGRGRCSNEICQPLRLPEVVRQRHLPRMKLAGEQDKSLLIKQKKSKEMKARILGSVDAKLLPDRPNVIKTKCKTEADPGVDGSGDSKDNCIRQEKVKSSEPPTLVKNLTSGQVKQECKPVGNVFEPVRPKHFYRGKPPNGQVYLRPKLDDHVLDEIQRQNRRPSTPIPHNEGSNKKGNLSERKKRVVLPEVTTSNVGNQLFRGESKSISKMILKPEVKPSLQVVRRKSKFMQNQRLQDVFSIEDKTSLPQVQQKMKINKTPVSPYKSSSLLKAPNLQDQWNNFQRVSFPSPYLLKSNPSRLRFQ